MGETSAIRGIPSSFESHSKELNEEYPDLMPALLMDNFSLSADLDLCPEPL
jgi:hypothetical protein